MSVFGWGVFFALLMLPVMVFWYVNKKNTKKCKAEEQRQKNEFEAFILEKNRTIYILERDKKKLQADNNKLKKLAFKDSLTGLLTRRAFEYDLQKFNGLFASKEKEYNRSRSVLKSLGIMSIDLDFFKNINDTYGHPVGDTVLQKVASTIVESLRQTDLVCRMGGEELTAALPEVPEDKLDELAEKVREAISGIEFEFFDPETKKPLIVTASVGVTYTENQFDYSKLTKKVDAALYEAKQKGRNQVVKIN